MQHNCIKYNFIHIIRQKMKSFIIITGLFIFGVKNLQTNIPDNSRIIEILKTGDGKSANTAFVVHTINEEYEILRHLQLIPQIQYFVTIEGEIFDVFKVSNKEIFFKIQEKKIII